MYSRDAYSCVELTDVEYADLVLLAKMRNTKASCCKETVLKHYENRDQPHIYGLLGEYAVSQILDVPLDRNVYYTHGDDGFDLICNGCKIDVKTSTYWPNPDLRVEVAKIRDDVDVYVLCFVDPKNPFRVYQLGFATPDMIKTINRTHQYKPYLPLNYIVLTQELLSMQDLVETLKGTE